MEIIAQLIGLAAIALIFVLYQQSDRKRILLLKMSTEVLWATHYLLLSSYSAVFTMLIGIMRELFFMNKDKFRHKNIVLCVFLLMYLTSAIVTFKSIYNIIPAFCSVIMTLSFWADNVKYMKLGTLPASVLMIVYNARCSSYAGILNETVVLCSLAVWFIRTMKKKSCEHKNKLSENGKEANHQIN